MTAPHQINSPDHIILILISNENLALTSPISYKFPSTFLHTRFPHLAPFVPKEKLHFLRCQNALVQELL